MDPISTHTSFTIEKATGGDNYRLQTIEVVVSRMKLSEMYFTGVRQRFPRIYDLWRGTWTGRFHPHKNNAHIPLIFSAIWADAARKASTSLAIWPIVSFVGYGTDDAPTARKREALISAQMKDDNAFLKQVDNLVSADLYGVSVQQVGWKRKEEYKIIESVDRLPLSGRIIKTMKKGKIVTFDGPITEQVDLLDFYPQPGKKRVEEMDWVIRRLFLDLDDCRYLAQQGTFDKGELARLEREGGVNSQIADQQSMVRRFATRAGMDDESIRWMDKYARPIEILEFWGRIPSELSPDGELTRVITVANRRYLLRNKPNPFWHKELPFVTFSPTPDPHYFYAPGKGEVIEKLQIIGNRYLNQSLDAADLIIDPMWFYDRAANLNTRNLYARPGKFIPVDGDPGKVVAPLMKDLQSLSVADNKINMIREYSQMGSGIVDDAVAGLQSDQRQTAREFIGRREAAGNRLSLEARIYEEMCLEKMANMMVTLDKQFLDTPAEVLILGDDAKIDPVTGKSIPTSRETINHDDMVKNYAARALGATTALSKGMKQQNLIALLQVMGSPLGQSVMGSVNALNFWRGIFREFEVYNVNEIFNSPDAAGGAGANMQGLIQNATGGQGGINNVPTSGQIVNGQPLPIPSNPGVPVDPSMASNIPTTMG